MPSPPAAPQHPPLLLVLLLVLQETILKLTASAEEQAAGFLEEAAAAEASAATPSASQEPAGSPSSSSQLLVPNQSPQNCILPPLKDRLERSSFFTKIRCLYTSFVAGKLNQKPRKQKNKAAKYYSSKPFRKIFRELARSLASSLTKKKKLSQNPLPARGRCFANPKKDHPPKSKTYRYCTRFRMVGCRFPTHKCATWRDRIGGKN